MASDLQNLANKIKNATDSLFVKDRVENLYKNLYDELYHLFIRNGWPIYFNGEFSAEFTLALNQVEKSIIIASSVAKIKVFAGKSDEHNTN